MANLLSPGIQVSEVDQSQITPVEGDSAAVFGGDFEKGPVGVHTLISSVQELRDNYGMPNTKNYNDYYQVQNFLAYSGAIYVSRAADINGTPTQLDGLQFEENAYKTNVNASKIEGVKVIEVDSVDVKFEKTDKFEVGQVLKFNDSNKEYKIKYVRNEVKQIPNPDYQPLTQLVVDPSQVSAYVDEVVSYVITTDAESYTVETDRPDVVLVNKSNKSLTALKVGTAIVTFKATKDGSRTNSFELKFDVQEKEQTKLIVSPEQLNIIQGEQGVLNIDTDASDYTIVSKNLGIASIESDKKTVNGVRVGSTTIEITAQAQGKTEVTKTITVTVTEAVDLPEITGVSFSPESVTAKINQGVQTVTATLPESATLKATIQDSEVATLEVSDNILKITPVAAGNTTVNVTVSKEGHKDFSSQISVTIEDLPEISDIIINKESLSFDKGGEDQTITVTAPEEATVTARSGNFQVAVLKSNTKIITVSPKFPGRTYVEVIVKKEGFKTFTKKVPVAVNSTTAPNVEVNPTEIISKVNQITTVTLNPLDVYALDSVAINVESSDGLAAEITTINDLEYNIKPLTQGTGTVKFICRKDCYPDAEKEISINVTAEDTDPSGRANQKSKAKKG